MNEFEAKNEGESADDMRALRMLVAVAILLVCIFIGCIDVTLRRQAIILGTQLDNAQKAWDAYEKTEQRIDQGRANILFSSLNEYARTHPDFQPIMQAVDRNLVVAPGKK